MAKKIRFLLPRRRMTVDIIWLELRAAIMLRPMYLRLPHTVRIMLNTGSIWRLTVWNSLWQDGSEWISYLDRWALWARWIPRIRKANLVEHCWFFWIFCRWRSCFQRTLEWWIYFRFRHWMEAVWYFWSWKWSAESGCLRKKKGMYIWQEWHFFFAWWYLWCIMISGESSFSDIGKFYEALRLATIEVLCVRCISGCIFWWKLLLGY